MKNMSYVFWWVPTFVDQITTKKKRYSHLAVGWNKSQITAKIKLRQEKKVQLSGHRLQCWIVLAGLSLCFLAGSLIKLQITTGKKVQLSDTIKHSSHGSSNRVKNANTGNHTLIS
jgi:hypothetical protein